MIVNYLSRAFFLSRYLKFRFWRMGRILFNAATTNSIQRCNFYYFAKMVPDYCNVDKRMAKYAIKLFSLLIFDLGHFL